MLDCNSHSATAQGYAQSINRLFELCNFPVPADISDKENMTAKLIHARERKETIARRRSPLSKEMYVAKAKLASASDQDSAELVTFDWFNVIKYTGFRVALYAQTTQSKVDKFEYASGNKVVKAFVSSDWKFYDENGRLMTIHSLDDSADPPKKLKITFRIQKNCQNGQLITFVADDKHPQICPVRSAYRIFLRAKRLGQSDD